MPTVSVPEMVPSGIVMAERSVGLVMTLVLVAHQLMRCGETYYVVCSSPGVRATYRFHLIAVLFSFNLVERKAC